MKSRLQEVETPILVLLRRWAGAPFNPYLEEILQMEGYFCYRVEDVTDRAIDDGVLGDAPVAVLTRMELSAAEMEALGRYVDRGGRLVAFRPPAALAGLFGCSEVRGVEDVYSLACEGFVVVDREHPATSGFPESGMQFRGDAELYMPEEANRIASFCTEPEGLLPFAGVSLWYRGRGATALFAYDLVETVVRLHQGNPEQASNGSRPDADRDNMFKPNDFYVGETDPRMKLVPQADLHQDLLVRVLRFLTDDGLPLLRVWHYPGGKPAVTFLNGDSDGMVDGDLQRVEGLLRRYGASFTVYVMEEHFSLFSPGAVPDLKGRGLDFGIHPNCGSLTPTVEQMGVHLEAMSADFEGHFGYRATSTRHDAAICPGWTETFETLSRLGYRIDTNHMATRYFYPGYLSGSGLPFKFIDRNGEMVDLYEQATLLVDDPAMHKWLRPTFSVEEALEVEQKVFVDCVERYHTVFHHYFHPGIQKDKNWHRYGCPEGNYAAKALYKALELTRDTGLPTFTGEAWAGFNDGRRAVRIKMLDAGGGRCGFQVGSARDVSGLTLMLPGWSDGAMLSSVRVDGQCVEVACVDWEGLAWGVWTMDVEAGTACRVEGTYGR